MIIQEVAMASPSSRKSKAQTGRTRRSNKDAIALLKADHRQVENWFEQFEGAKSDSRKRELASSICEALRVHMAIEEEIFYPAFWEATGDEDVHHEAVVEHAGARKLVEEIESSSPADGYFTAKVKVLS